MRRGAGSRIVEGAMPAPHAMPITVSEADRLTLQSWARRPKTAQALALRARIVLAAAAGQETNLEIAERLQTNRHTVAKWRGRYARRGLTGLTDEPRPGAPRTITDARVDAARAGELVERPRARTAPGASRACRTSPGPARRARSPTTAWTRCWRPRWSRRPRAARTGAPGN